MKKNLRYLVVFIFLILVSLWSYPAFANQAIVLSDAQLDNVSAAGFDINISAVLALRSSVASQINVSALNSASASAISLSNSNLTNIYNIGNAGLAAQYNIAAVVAETGDIVGANINNHNDAGIENTATSEGYAQVNNMGTNTVYAEGSAVASQKNIGVLIAEQGNIMDSFINNNNSGTLTNFGDSAESGQSNIAVIVANKGIYNSGISNANLADVVNTGGSHEGTATQDIPNYYPGPWGNHNIIKNIDNISINYSAVANQSNLAILISGDIQNTFVSSWNKATLQAEY